MRGVVALLVGIVGMAGLGAQDAKPAKRFGIEANRKLYPQDSPKNALASVLKTIEDKQIDYLLAHLADPKFVDGRVEVYGGKFEDLVKETKTRLVDDPSALKQLRRFQKEGTWQIEDNTATVRIKDVNDRWVYLRKVDGQWLLENRWKPMAEEKDKP